MDSIATDLNPSAPSVPVYATPGGGMDMTLGADAAPYGIPELPPIQAPQVRSQGATPEDVTEVISHPDFAALDPDTRGKVLENMLGEASANVAAQPDFDADTYRAFGDFAQAARKKVDAMSGIPSQAWQAVKGVGRGLGLTGMGVASDLDPLPEIGNGFRRPHVPLSDTLSMAGQKASQYVEAARTKLGQAEGIQSAPDAAIEDLHKRIDAGEFLHAGEDPGRWVLEQNEKLAPVLSNYHQRMAPGVGAAPPEAYGAWALANGLQSPRNAALLGQYMRTRNEGAWSQLRENLLESPSHYAAAQKIAKRAESSDAMKSAALLANAMGAKTTPEEIGSMAGDPVNLAMSIFPLLRAAKGGSILRNLLRGQAEAGVLGEMNFLSEHPAATFAQQIENLRQQALGVAGLQGLGLGAGALGRKILGRGKAEASAPGEMQIPKGADLTGVAKALEEAFAESAPKEGVNEATKEVATPSEPETERTQPTERTAAEALDGRSAAHVLEELKTQPGTIGKVAATLMRSAGVRKVLKTVRFERVSDADAKVKGRMYFHQGVIAIPDGAPMTPALLLHEMVHGFTLQAIWDHVHRHLTAGATGAAYGRGILQALTRQGVPEPVRQIIRLYLDTARKTGHYEALFGREGLAGSDADAAHAAGLPYGLGSLHEFVSEGLSSAEFQRVMEGIKTAKEPQGIWRAFVEAVRKLFGGSKSEPGERQAWRDLLGHAMKLADEGESAPLAKAPSSKESIENLKDQIETLKYEGWDRVPPEEYWPTELYKALKKSPLWIESTADLTPSRLKRMPEDVRRDALQLLRQEEIALSKNQGPGKSGHREWMEAHEDLSRLIGNLQSRAIASFEPYLERFISESEKVLAQHGYSWDESSRQYEAPLAKAPLTHQEAEDAVRRAELHNPQGTRSALTELAQRTGAAIHQIRAFLSPASLGLAQRGTTAIRERTAELERRRMQGETAMREASRFFERRSNADNLRFINEMEDGRRQSTPQLQRIANELRAALDERVRIVQSLGTGALQNVIQNYFPHIWQDAQAAGNWYQRVFSKRPLEGSRNFLKQRVIPTLAEGMSWRTYDDQGAMQATYPDEAMAQAHATQIGGSVGAPLRPVSFNPIELTLAKLHEMDKYIMAHQILGDYRARGLLRFVRTMQSAPDGWAPIDDRIAEARQVQNGGVMMYGRWHAPEDTARVLNNYLSPGLAGRVGIYDAFRYVGNALNQAQLALSAFHAMAESINAAVGAGALGLMQASEGEIGRGAVNLAKGATLILPTMEQLRNGDRLLREYLRPGTVGGDFAQMADALIAAGGRVSMDRLYSTGAIGKFWAALRHGNYGGAILKAPFAALEYAARPIMEWMVPRLKLGAFVDMARHELARLPAGATREQMQAALSRAWDSIDNRMGQLVYDNLFWNKALKDGLMASVRSLGWNLGTIRELGGGMLDAATTLQRLAQGDRVITHRLAYTIMLPIYVALWGSMYQYLRTGKGPQDLKDAYLPRTGATGHDGTPERVMLPTYMKDLASYAHHPLKTLVNKSGPALNLIGEMYANEDFFGTRIRNEDDPLVRQAMDEAAFVLRQFVPFTVRNWDQRAPGSGIGAESFFGVNPAPAELSRTPAHNKMVDLIVSKTPKGGRTPEETQRSQLRRELLDRARMGQDVREQARQGGFSGKQQQALLKASKQDPRLVMFKHLTAHEQADVLAVANAEETKLFKAPFLRKFAKLSALERRDVRDRASGPAREILGVDAKAPKPVLAGYSIPPG